MVDVVIPAVVLTVLGTLALGLIFRFAVDSAPTTYMLALGVYANFQDRKRAVDPHEGTKSAHHSRVVFCCKGRCRGLLN